LWHKGGRDTRHSVLGRGFNVAMAAEFPDVIGKRFGAIVRSLGDTPAPIVVERAMYNSAGGVFWSAGTNSLATRLQ
jgi:hypothetical protein